MASHSRWSVLAAPLLALTAVGCAKPQAAAVEPAPPAPLVAPLPPPRIILPPQPDAPAPLRTEIVEAPTSPRTSTPARSPQPKPEVPPVDQLADAPAAPDEEAASAPSLELKQRGGLGSQGVREQLDAAAQDLENVDYAKLSRDLQAQYDTAKRFIVLGGQALKEQNVLFAATLADKASAIARLLLAR